jgi:hypothetical protein
MTNSQQNQYASLHERFAQRLTARLSDASAALPYDISERLRAAREQALGQRKKAQVRTAGSLVASGGAAALTLGGDDEPSWLNRFASALPLVALIVGLITINLVQNDLRADELAEVDAAILTDDLPPAAYTDPGFAQFLKLGNNSAESSPAQQQQQ